MAGQAERMFCFATLVHQSISFESTWTNKSGAAQQFIFSLVCDGFYKNDEKVFANTPTNN
jgi:hypothetical protein